jgi:hypothetical protein
VKQPGAERSQPLAKVAQPSAKVAQPSGKVAQPSTDIERVVAEPVDLLPGEKPPGYAGTGRPSLYRPEYDQMIVDYFDKDPHTDHEVEQGNGVVKLQRMMTPPPMLAGFAKSIGVSMSTVNRWGTDVDLEGRFRYPSFAGLYARARVTSASIGYEFPRPGLYASALRSGCSLAVHFSGHWTLDVARVSCRLAFQRTMEPNAHCGDGVNGPRNPVRFSTHHDCRLRQPHSQKLRSASHERTHNAEPAATPDRFERRTVGHLMHRRPRSTVPL